MATTDWLTGALVAITGYYAWQNRRMVREMAEARAVTVLPHLAVAWHGVSPVLATIRISSVGPGPAVDVEVDVRFVPIMAEDPPVVRHISTSLMPPGDTRELLPIFAQNEPMQTMEDLAARFTRIELEGTVRDVTGKSHSVRDELADIAEWRRVQTEALVRWTHPDPEKRLAKALREVLKQPTAELSKSLALIAAQMRRDESRDE